MAAEMTPAEALAPAIILLGVGAAAALTSRLLKLSPIVGYLIAGVIIGPYALGGAVGFTFDESTTHLLAELGVVFLLFDIGMHVSMRELRESRGDLIGLAPSHLVICSAIFSLILGLAGVDWPIAVAVGVSLGLSSTAVVSGVLSERSLNSCPLGRSATHVLIFQDIIAIFLLIFAANLADDPETLPLTMAIAGVSALIAFAAAMLASKFLIGPVLRTLAKARNAEAFTAFTLVLVLGAAVATATAGLSLTLGAFLAGLTVSGTAYRHQIQMETGPFRALLLSFFFISVGLGLDMPQLIANLPLVLAAAMSILILKTIGGFAAARINRWSVPGATQLAFLMAQGSEFTLVVLSMAAIAAGLPPLIETVLVAAVAVSLAIAPSWAGLGLRIARKLAERLTEAGAATAQSSSERPVVVFGMTAGGRLAADALRDHDIPHVALDSDPDRFLAAVADGYQVSFGDAANLKLIDAIGANNARAAVIGAPRYEVSRDITETIRRRYPDMDRFVSVETAEDVTRFRALGMRAHLCAAEPKGIEMAADMLAHLGVNEADVSTWISNQRDRFEIDEVEDDTREPEAA